MAKKNEDLKTYTTYLDKWENLSFPRRYSIFRKANELFGKKNPLLEITDEETVKQDYNRYQREMRQKNSQRTTQRKPTRHTSDSDEEEQAYYRKAMRAKSKLDEQEISQLKERVTTLEQESEEKQFIVDELSDEVADLKQKNQKLEAEIVDLKHKFEVYRIETAKTINEMKDKQVSTEQRVKDLQEDLEQEKLLRQNLEQKCTEINRRYLEIEKKYEETEQRCTKTEQKCKEAEQRCAETEKKCQETELRYQNLLKRVNKIAGLSQIES